MAGFLYFTKTNISTIDQLLKGDCAELKRLAEDRPSLSTGGNSIQGPDGEGYLCALPSRKGENPSFRYDPVTQEWRKRVGYWIGWEKANPPKPVDLEKSPMRSGHPIRLRDGNDWIVPVIGPAYSKLPRTFVIAEDGEITSEVESRYHEIFARSETFFNMRYGPMPETEEQIRVAKDVKRWTTILQFVADVLAINYRVCVRDLTSETFALVDTENVFDILDCCFGAIDVAAQDAAQKKIA